MRTKTTLAPVFFADEFALSLNDPARVEAALTEPRNVDLLTWNVFASLERHRDETWLAHRLQAFGGTGINAPVRMALWTGRQREPLLPPNQRYLATVRERISQADSGGEAGEQALKAAAAPAEADVRIESGGVLCLVTTMLERYPTGTAGRDHLTELIDAGLDQAARLDSQLAVAVVYASGTQLASEVSAKVQQLRTGLKAALPHRDRVPEVVLREVSWQQLIKVWETEVPWLELGGQPVKPFLAHCAQLGLR